MCRIRSWLPVFVVLLLLVFTLTPQSYGQQNRRRQGKKGRNHGNSLKAGDKAPDFNLHRLNLTGTDGKATISDDKKVQLSSLTGKKPFVLLFTSYT